MLLLTLVAACYWQKYPRLVETHAELLSAMARKSEDVLRERGGYRPEDLAELRYPYDRARDFARIVRDRRGERGSFRGFEDLLGHYEALLSVVDRLNASPDPRKSPDAAALSRLVARIARDQEAVLAALRAEN